MGQVVTLELPETLVQRARTVAVRTNRQLEDVLLDWLDRAANELPVELLSDEDVLQLRDMQMSDAAQAELSDLLAGQREGLLDETARQRLDELLATYRRSMVRKAQALKVAVARGLQPPLP